MKVIIQNQKGAYKHLNGKTFEVHDLMLNKVGVKIQDNSMDIVVDFSMDEVIIVDIVVEINNARQNKLRFLEDYIKYKKIQINA